MERTLEFLSSQFPIQGRLETIILRPTKRGACELTTETTAILSFVRPADSLDDHYVLQSGNDLTGWNDLAIDPYITVSPGSDGTENIVVTVPLETLGAGSPRFLVRLQAIRP